MWRLSRKKREALIADLISARSDLLTIAHEHNLTPDAVAEWVSDSANHQVLMGLCVLADLQTQLLLSRYRLLAAGRLIRLATGETESAEVARRACVDLLKLDLKRTELLACEIEPTGETSLETLRDLVYGRAEVTAEDTGGDESAEDVDPVMDDHDAAAKEGGERCPQIGE